MVTSTRRDRGLSHDQDCLISEKGSVSYGMHGRHGVAAAAWRVDA